MPFDSSRQALGDNTQVVQSVETIRGNLKAVGMHLQDSTYVLGRDMAFDPEADLFTSDAGPNALLTREYRRDLEVPGAIG